MCCLINYFNIKHFEFKKNVRSAFLLMNEIKIYTNQISPSVPCSESRYFILYMLFQSSDDNTMDIKQDVHNASCFRLVPDRWEKRDG